MSNIYETPNIIGVKALDNYLIYLKYETNEEKVYDMKALISKNKFYNKLRDKKYFKLVKPRGDSIEWIEGEDVSPESLYYQSINLKEYTEEIKELD